MASVTSGYQLPVVRTCIIVPRHVTGEDGVVAQVLGKLVGGDVHVQVLRHLDCLAVIKHPQGHLGVGVVWLVTSLSWHGFIVQRDERVVKKNPATCRGGGK